MSLSDESAANATNGKHPPTPFNIDGEPELLADEVLEPGRQPSLDGELIGAAG